MKRKSLLLSAATAALCWVAVGECKAQRLTEVSTLYTQSAEPAGSRYLDIFRDINGDGKLERLVEVFASTYNHLDKYGWYDQNGNLIKSLPYTKGSAVLVEDLNSDGVEDYFVKTDYYGAIYDIYLSEGTTYKHIEWKDGSDKQNFCVLDVNHDGRLDIFGYQHISNSHMYRPFALLQTASSDFAYQSIEAVTDETDLADAMFSTGGNGSFSTNSGTTTSMSFLNGMFVHARPFDFSDEESATATRRAVSTGGAISDISTSQSLVDINNDGFTDIVQKNGGTSLLSLPDGRYYASSMAGDVANADLNGDGLQDIVLFKPAEKAVMLYLTQPGGDYEEHKLIDNGAITGMYCQDLNADKQPDILLQAASDTYSFLVFFINDGRGNFSKKECAIEGYHLFSSPVDFSNNGLPSVIASYSNYRSSENNDCKLKYLTWDENCNLTVSEMTHDGSPLYAYWGRDNHYRPYGTLNVADFDGDGLTELIVRVGDKYGSYSIYTPATGVANTAPQQMAVPNVIYDKQSGCAKVEWQQGEDQQTPAAELTYEVRMGVTEDGGSLMHYQAGVSRYCVVDAGTWPQQAVYVSVRAIDANGLAGAWSPSVSFTNSVNNTAFTFALDTDYVTTAPTDTVTLCNLGVEPITYDLPQDCQVVETDGAITKVLFTSPGLKTVTARADGANSSSRSLLVYPTRLGKSNSYRAPSTPENLNVFDLNGNGLTEGIAYQGLFTFDTVSKTYKKQATMFNMDITKWEVRAIVDLNMDGLPDTYGQIVKNGSSYLRAINKGNLEFELKNEQPLSSLIDINNDGLLDEKDITIDQYAQKYVVDLDRDGLLDYKDGYFYRNLGNGEFEKITFDSKGGSVGAVMDINNDGYPDIICVRNDSYFALLGDKGLTYSNVVDLPGMPLAYDIDNNGYVDFYKDVWRDDDDEMLICGTADGYVEYYKGEYPIKHYDMQWTGDIDNDGRPDKNIYPLMSSIANEAPTAPATVTVNQDEDYVVVSWTGATDKETPYYGLRYNLSVKEKGATGDNSYIISPLNQTNSTAKATEWGNSHYRFATRYPIPASRFVAGKTYEIQVQTLDNWYEHSSFSPVVEFTPVQQTVFDMAEKAGVGISVPFTLKDNSGAQPVIDADGGIVADNTITWETPGIKTVTIQCGTASSKRSVLVMARPQLALSVPNRMLTGSMIQVVLPEAFHQSEGRAQLTASSGMTCLVEGTQATLVTPEHATNCELTVTYDDDVFGHLSETMVIELTAFEPQIRQVTTTEEGCLVKWDAALNSAEMQTGKVTVYRETNVQGLYEKIGEASITDGQYADVTARPDVKSYRYRIAMPTVYGGESAPSEVHSSVLLLANRGLGNDINLHWTSYTGAQVATYTIYAGPTRNQMEIVDKLSGSAQSYVHHRSGDTPTYYAIGYTLIGEETSPTRSHRRDAADGQASSNVICSDEAYGVVMVQGISIYERDGLALLNSEQPELHLQAIVSPTLATLTSVAWSIAKGDELATVAQNGVLNIKENKSGGTVTVQAQAIDG